MSQIRENLMTARDAAAWFTELCDALGTVAARGEAAGLTWCAPLTLQPWQVGNTLNVWYVCVATCAGAPDIALDLWLDSYLDREDRFILGCWPRTGRKQRLLDVCAAVEQRWKQPPQVIQPRDRDSASARVLPKRAEVLQRDPESLILDSWYREYYLGRYRTGLRNKPAREAVGVVVSTLEELAGFFAAPAAARDAVQGGADPLPAEEVERRRRLHAVLARDQQAAFRAAALRHFQGRCVVSGCDVPQALEAAHIIPVSAGGAGERGAQDVQGLHAQAQVQVLCEASQLDPDAYDHAPSPSGRTSSIAATDVPSVTGGTSVSTIGATDPVNDFETVDGGV